MIKQNTVRQIAARATVSAFLFVMPLTKDLQAQVQIDSISAGPTRFMPELSDSEKVAALSKKNARYEDEIWRLHLLELSHDSLLYVKNSLIARQDTEYRNLVDKYNRAMGTKDTEYNQLVGKYNRMMQAQDSEYNHLVDKYKKLNGVNDRLLKTSDTLVKAYNVEIKAYEQIIEQDEQKINSLHDQILNSSLLSIVAAYLLRLSYRQFKKLFSKKEKSTAQTPA